MTESQLSPNTISIIGLAAEYCQTLADARKADRNEFVSSMLRLLPRIYIALTDAETDPMAADDPFFNPGDYVDEQYYDSIRLGAEYLLGPDDTFLETFEQDMKYSDTPIAASVSELLADIFQSLYNFTYTVRDTEAELVPAALAMLKEDFENYWGQKLCNVMRPLNAIRYETIQ